MRTMGSRPSSRQSAIGSRQSALLALACLALAILAPASPARGAACLDQAIQQLVAQVEDGAPEETINGIAIWLWLDEKLPEPIRRAFRDDLEIALINSPRFQYFNRDRFRQLLREHQTTLAQLADPAAMKAFAAAGIDGFLSIEVLDTSFAHPDFPEQDAYCTLLAKLTDAKTASIAWANFIEGANPAAIKKLLGDAKPTKGTTRYRELARAIAESIRKANPLEPPPTVAAGAEPNPAAPAPAAPEEAKEPTLKLITLSTPNKDGTAGIGIQNPINATFDLKAFQDELLVALCRTGNHAYVDPTHIARLVAAWTRDSEATATANKQALAQAFALDGYLFGEIRSAEGTSVEVSMRLTNLHDGSEAWAGKFTGADSFLSLEPKPLPDPPVPREDPKEPAPLTLEEIERPLKPPVPQPDLAPLPEIPTPPRCFNPLAALLYIPLGLPRDAIDTLFLTTDRIPLLGAATTPLYRHAGIAAFCRLGTDERFRDDITTGRALTWGQLASQDPYPTLLPLVTSARRNPAGSSNYILQLSLGTLTIFDILDATYAGLDRTPIVGALTTPITLPLNYGWRSVPDDRRDYVAEIAPGSPRSRLTYGSLRTAQPWSLLPNARSSLFTFAVPWSKARTYRDYARRYDEAVKANDKLLADWLAAEEARRKYNDDALKTLRQRNADLQRRYQQELEAVRRDNETALQNYQRDKRAAEEHNLRAKTLNALAQSVLDLPGALTPKPPRPAIPRKPRPLPKAPTTPAVTPPATPTPPPSPPLPHLPRPPRRPPRPVRSPSPLSPRPPRSHPSPPWRAKSPRTPALPLPPRRRLQPRPRSRRAWTLRPPPSDGLRMWGARRGSRLGGQVLDVDDFVVARGVEVEEDGSALVAVVLVEGAGRRVLDAVGCLDVGLVAAEAGDDLLGAGEQLAPYPLAAVGIVDGDPVDVEGALGAGYGAEARVAEGLAPLLGEEEAVARLDA